MSVPALKIVTVLYFIRVSLYFYLMSFRSWCNGVRWPDEENRSHSMYSSRLIRDVQSLQDNSLSIPS